MTMVVLRHIDAEDWVEFVLRYIPSLAFAFLVSVGAGVILVIAKRRGAEHFGWTVVLLALLAPMVAWGMYFGSTAKWILTLTLLNSEDERVAENAYRNLLAREVVDLDHAVNLAINKYPKEPNLRFYAACLVAEMLATNDEQTVNAILKKVGGAPIIEPRFFGTNGLNYQLYVPGRAQPKMPVRDLIEQRLDMVRRPRTAANTL